MIILCAAPVGTAIALQSHYKFHVEARDAGIQGVVMAAASAVVGCVLLLLGMLITRLRRRVKDDPQRKSPSRIATTNWSWGA